MADSLNTHNDELTNAEPAQHTAEMLEKAEQIERNNQGGDERPDWLPEKFNSVEDLANAYSQLEKRMGQGEEEDAEIEDIQEEEIEELPDGGDVEQVLDSVGLDFDVFQQEYNERGELSADAYEALEEAGFPRSLVDNYIQGQEALSGSFTSEMQDIVGGEEAYAQMTAWASDNLPSDEIDAFNATMETGDPALSRFAIQGMFARYRSEGGGSEPTLVQGENMPVSGGKFDSAAELTAAMRDPRYAKDPAYRSAVAQKLSRSSVF